MTPNKFVMPKWPLWMKATRVICDVFELGDHEYIRWSFQHWPFSCWLTILESRYRVRWERYFPWRFRLGLASLLRQLVWSRCTGKCGKRFSLRELVKRPSDLYHFQSGSICHKSCSRLEVH